MLNKKENETNPIGAIDLCPQHTQTAIRTPSLFAWKLADGQICIIDGGEFGTRL